MLESKLKSTSNLNLNNLTQIDVSSALSAEDFLNILDKASYNLWNRVYFIKKSDPGYYQELVKSEFQKFLSTLNKLEFISFVRSNNIYFSSKNDIMFSAFLPPFSSGKIQRKNFYKNAGLVSNYSQSVLNTTYLGKVLINNFKEDDGNSENDK